MRKYYYVAVKHNHHCDIIRQYKMPDYALQQRYNKDYSYMFGAYALKSKAVQVANYQGLIIDTGGK